MVTNRCKVALGIVVFLLIAWFSGLVTMVLVGVFNVFAFPLDVSEEVSITRVYRDADVPPLEVGADLRISSDRADFLLTSAFGWRAGFLSPGLIRHGTTIEAVNTIELPEGSFAYFPLRITIDDSATSPLLRILIKDAFLNELMRDSDILGRREKRKKWIFGHYDRKNFKKFDVLHIYTVPHWQGGLIKERLIVGEAAGHVRYKFEDSLFDVRTTARVSKMVLDGRLSVNHTENGVKMAYKVAVTDLKANFNNVAPAIDAQLSSKLKESFEQSLNKKKRTEKLDKMDFPAWIPLDLNIDIRLIP